jgi:hypothetical protein
MPVNKPLTLGIFRTSATLFAHEFLRFPRNLTGGDRVEARSTPGVGLGPIGPRHED